MDMPPAQKLEGRTYQGIKLQICNLDLEVDIEYIQREFSKYGVVVNAEVSETTKYSPFKSAIVTYYSPGEAQCAVRCLNGKKLLKNTLYVGLAQPKRSRSRSYNNAAAMNITNLAASWDGHQSSSGYRQSTDLAKSQSAGANLHRNSSFKSVGDSLIEFKQGCTSKSSGKPSRYSSDEERDNN